MNPSELEIRIAPDGQVSINVLGAQGTACLDLTEFLEKAVGEVTDRSHKSEYYQSQTQSQNQVGIQYPTY